MSGSWTTVQAALGREASTRSAALLRIGLVAILWARYGGEHILWHVWTRPEHALFAVAFWVGSALTMVGWHTRVGNVILAAAMVYSVYYLGLVMDDEPYRHHHVTILAYAFTWLCFVPSGGSYSVDRWLAVRRAEREGRPPPPERGPVWGLHLLMFQVAVVYFFGAWDKTYPVFHERMEQIYQYAYFGSEAPGPWFGPAMFLMGYGAVVVEYLLVPGLYVKRWQWWAIPMGIALHVVIYVTLPVNTFTITMITLYLAFLDPDDVHDVIERIQGHPGRSAVAAET